MSTLKRKNCSSKFFPLRIDSKIPYKKGKKGFVALRSKQEVNSKKKIKKKLTNKAPITTAADDIHKFFVIVFQRKLAMIFQVNPLLGRGFT